MSDGDCPHNYLLGNCPICSPVKSTFHREMLARGYEEVGESGGRLWEIRRGGRIGSRIVDAVIAPDGLSVYVKIQ